MKINQIYFFLFVSILVLSGVSCTSTKETKPAKVEVRLINGRYQFFVDGQAFYIKGAGCEYGDIENLAKHGANSFRTWRTNNDKQDALEVLDLAHKNGLMVLMGLEVARERHGFDYDDSIKVKEQFDVIRGEVERLKDHPALLAWAIGNELNLSATNFKVYDAVNDISKMIHEIDPYHPTTTTTSGIYKELVDYILKNCSDLDFLSIQMYGDIQNLRKRIANAGWLGPCIVSEWGATGHWEVARTEWGAPIEQTSQEKAKSLIDRHNFGAYSNMYNCMGSYVFVWEQKQERTPTWYGLFLETGEETEMVDAMHYLWNGRWPENRSPSIDSMRIDTKSAFDNITLRSNILFNAEVFVENYERDSLTYRWEILPESTDLGHGGDVESRPMTLFNTEGTNRVEIFTPQKAGAYRLFVYVIDDNNKAGTANIPFKVVK